MEIRDCSVDDLEAALDVRTRSFGPIAEADRSGWYAMQSRAAGECRLLAAYDGAQLVAAARINPFQQWWHGQAVPMAGIAGVVVAPEHRGRGVGRRLLLAVIERSASLGCPVSALFPATVPPYRAIGWELAGRQQFVTVPTENIRGLAVRRPPVKVRRVGRDDVAEVQGVVAAIHAAHRDNGPIQWPDHEVADWLSNDETFAYLADDGFLAYRWSGSDTLAVELLVGASEATLRALWALVGSGSSTARTVRACVPPDDPVIRLTRDLAVKSERERWWMLRLIDARAAIEARGFAAGICVEVPVTIVDPERPGNSGNWLLRVSGGRGALEPGGPGGVRLNAGGVAALYAGTRMSALRRAGLATGGEPAADAALDLALCGQAFMLDYF